MNVFGCLFRAKQIGFERFVKITFFQNTYKLPPLVIEECSTMIMFIRRETFTLIIMIAFKTVHIICVCVTYNTPHTRIYFRRLVQSSYLARWLVTDYLGTLFWHGKCSVRTPPIWKHIIHTVHMVPWARIMLREYYPRWALARLNLLLFNR